MLFIIYVAILVYLCIPLIPGLDILYKETPENKKKRIIAVSTLGAISFVMIVVEFFMKKNLYSDASDMVSAFILTCLAIYINAKTSIYEVFGIVIVMTLYVTYNHTNYLKGFRTWRERVSDNIRRSNIQSIVRRRPRAKSLPSSQFPIDFDGIPPVPSTL